MAKKSSKKSALKTVETLVHEEDKRKNIPTAELQSVIDRKHAGPVSVKYPRNPDLDPQLVWRGKDEQDWSDLVVHAPPLYIQEKVHPKALIDDLLKQSAADRDATEKSTRKKQQLDLFGDFNGIPAGADKTDFYQHDQNWSNRMILGDSLQVMASLAEREGLRGKVQCIYFDPPYGIKFNSNFQWSTTSRDVKDGNAQHITREPEQVKAFRDTWRDGIHSYLTYLRDRLTVARDLLTESGSIFVQIGDENVHRVRAVMDEVFGDENFILAIPFKTTTSSGATLLEGVCDYIIWFAKSIKQVKYRQLYNEKTVGAEGGTAYGRVEIAPFERRALTTEERGNPESLSSTSKIYRIDNLTSQRPMQGADLSSFSYQGETFSPGKGTFKTDLIGMSRLGKSSRVEATSKKKLYYVRYIDDFPVFPLTNQWSDTSVADFAADKLYVVQSAVKVIQRCLLMATDPGDLVLDPTCGSGTTAYVAEQWGRRLDHDRYLPRRPGTRPRPHHGGTLPLLSPRRHKRRSAEGSRSHPHCPFVTTDTRQHPHGFRLRTGSPHHAEVDRQ